MLLIVPLLAAAGCAPYKVIPRSETADRPSASDKELSIASSKSDGDTPYSDGSTLPASYHQDDNALDRDLEDICLSSGMDVCVSFIDLQTGDRATYQDSKRVVSASMIKLLIAYTFLERVEEGAYSLDDYYTLQTSDSVGGTGTLSLYGAGAQITYREILEKMISESDNTGANILIDAIGMDSINGTASKLKLHATQLNRRMMDSNAMANGIENYTSAADIASLLRMVYNETFINPAYSALVLKALEAQQDAGGIANGLPREVIFAHKTGTLDSVRHDGGIVESDHPFILVVLCSEPGLDEQNALNTMSQLANTVYSETIGSFD